MARSLNIVIGADIEKLRKGLQDAVSAIQASGSKMSAETAKAATEIEKKLKDISTKNPTAGTVRQLTNLAMQARALGPEFAQTANDIIRAAGKMKDSISDARAEVSYFASDTRRIDAVLGGVQAVAGAFGAVEGALALTGVESEDLQKTMVKLQGAIALVNGVQAIQAVLLDENATKTGVLALANRVYTSVTAGATGATLAFRTALMSIGIGVLIAGIGALVANFDKLKDAIFPADKALKDLNNTIDKSIAKQQNEVKILEAKGDKLGAFAKNEQILNETLKKARANFGKNNKENWGKIVDDTKTALTVLKIERENYITEENTKQQEHAAEVLKKQGEEYEKRKAKLKKFNDEQAKITKEGRERALSYLDLDRAGIARAIPKAKPQPISGPIQSTSKAMSEETRLQRREQLKQEINQIEYEERMVKSMEGVNAAFNNLSVQGLESFGQALGDILSGQINSFDDFGKALLGSVAQFMRAFGSALIATATASKAFKELLIKDPVLAAAAGVALVAGSAVISGMLKKGPQPTAFAEGGIVSGPTLGLVGEYPNARNNPEVIAPLDKLKGMLKTGDNSSGFVASTTIAGRDLAIVLERYNKDSKRG
jgi:hypothetical protein